MVEKARSLWLDELADRNELDPGLPSRAALQSDLEVDVAIVGGGFTGLWTAYYLAQLDPSLTVLVIEKTHVGFGASGRNGGWVVGELAAGIEKYAERRGLDESLRLTRAVFDAVDEVGRIVDTEAIDCGFAKGGVIRMARNRPQLQRQIEEVTHHHKLGIGEEEIRLLNKQETEAIINATGILGGIMFAPCAAVDPARLVLGLATACEKAGVTIVERTAAEAIGPRQVVTETGTISASVVVQATEAYTRDLKSQRRRLAPFYSRMIATEPLSEDVSAPNRVGQSPDFCRRPAHGHLRSTNQRRAHRLRRQGCALPVWIEDQPVDGGAPRFASPGTRSVGRPVSDPGRHRDHPPLGRSFRCAKELDAIRRLRPGQGHRHRRWLCRRRRGRRQSRRSDPGRLDHQHGV